jgi:hypothetical protein
MTVTPPKGWGKITGTVSGTSCKGDTAPIRGAQIQINAKGGGSLSLKTAADGTYAYWVDSTVSQYSVIASKDGWVTQVSDKVKVKAGKTTTANFTLKPTTC